MTWAEFQIRSFGFKRVQKWQMFLTREIAYEVHVGHYSWGKKKPPRKEKYWPLEGNRGKDEKVEALKAAWEKYKNGKS